MESSLILTVETRFQRQIGQLQVARPVVPVVQAWTPSRAQVSPQAALSSS